MRIKLQLSRTILLAGAALALAVLAGARVQAQDDFEKVQPAAPQPAPGNRPMEFDWLAYGYGKHAPEARHQLETRLSLYLERIDRVCALTAVQKKMLMLAGQGEITRHFDQVDELRRLYTANPKPYGPIVAGLAKLPLAGDQGSFDYSAFFYKICRTNLSPEQMTLYRADRRAAREQTHRAMVQFMVLMLDDVAVLNHDQRTKLAKLVSDSTRTSRRTGATMTDFLVVAAETVRISESKIKPVLSPEQWQASGNVLGFLRAIDARLGETLASLPPDPALDEPGTPPNAPGSETTKAAKAAAKAQEPASEKPAGKK